MTRSAWTESTRWAAWALIVVPGLMLALVTHVRTPGWDLDPLVNYVPMTGIGPGTAVLLQSLIVLGAGVAVAAGSGGGGCARGRWSIVEPWLVLIGAAGVLIHGLGALGLGDLRTGAAMLAFVAAAVGLRGLCADELRARATLAALLGAALAVMADGVLQVTIEHAQTVDAYRDNREAVLRSNGWTPDSPQARSYERRLMNAEPTGWFGLANVFATLAAALAAGGIAAAAVSLKAGARTRWAAPAMGAVIGVAGLIGLWLSGSKGGIGALGLGLIAAGGVWWLGRRGSRLAGVVLPGAIALVLAGLVVRGLIGERLGELSLLFRWFYVETAARIWLDHPLLGVGPDGFQAAYSVAKPAISPESVRSPHSVLFDWLGTLGAFGLAWAAVLIGLAWRAGLGLARGLDRSGAQESGDTPRGLAMAMRGVAAIGLAAMVWSAVVEAPALTPEAALARGAGAVLWVTLAIGLAGACSSRAIRAAALAAGSVVLVHAMLEVSPVLAGSAAWCGMAIGLAAARPGVGAQGGTGSSGSKPARANGLAAGCGLALVSVVLVFRGSVPLWAWAGHMTASAEAASQLTDPEARSRPQPGAVAERLERALAVRPGDLPTRSALTGLLRWIGRASGDREAIERAIELAERGAALRPGRVAAWGNLANVKLAARRVLELDPERDRRLALDAARALERAAGLDINAVRPVWRLVELYSELGETDEAAAWAAEALERHELLRLDPLVGLTAAQVERARALAGE